MENTAPFCFTEFNQPIAHNEVPTEFNNPFNYEPHPLCILASEQLQQHIQTQNVWKHNFGFEPNKEVVELKEIGKMFGVLVVQKQDGALGFLSAFSGKLANANHHKGFVPPVFDSLDEAGFLNQGMIALKVINDQVKELQAAGCKATNELLMLKQKRKAHSQALQHRLFTAYQFLNKHGQTQNPYDIFGKTPPAGAGECAAPKLLQYAYQKQLKPIAMAEFWWGIPPSTSSTNRIHGNYYPSCQEKCKSILGWMLG